MKRIRYCGSKIWSYEKETFPDNDPIYWLFCDNEQIGTCPSLSFMKDLIKNASKGKTLEDKKEKAIAFLGRY